MGTNNLTSDSLTSQVVPISLNLEQATNLIIERARQLVNQLVEYRGHDKPPFLPGEFARLQGIKEIAKADLGEVSAVLLRFADGNVIKVNEKDNPTRRNFSCAHEIGHSLLRELRVQLNTGNVEFRNFNPQARDVAVGKARERLCDIAAAELLMPELIFKKYLSGFGVSVCSIERLATIFRVSVQAVAIRIAEVSTEPCIALLWRLTQRTKSKALRLAWRVGPGRQSRGKANYVPVHMPVRYPSKLHEAYNYSSPVKCHKLFRLDTGLKRLPMESKGFGRGEHRHVISLAFSDR